MKKLKSILANALVKTAIIKGLTVFSVIFGCQPNISIFIAIFRLKLPLSNVNFYKSTIIITFVLLQFKYFRLQCHCQHPVIWRRMRRRKMRAIIQKLQFHQFKHFCGNRHNINIFIEKRTIFIKKVS